MKREREREPRGRGKRACVRPQLIPHVMNGCNGAWKIQVGGTYLHDTVDTTMTSSTSTLISIPLCDLSGV